MAIIKTEIITLLDSSDFPLTVETTSVSTSTNPSRNHCRRLSDIAQLSTETQTEEMSCQVNWTSLDESEVLARNVEEAETQFDLDDILCSNYTQTGNNHNYYYYDMNFS